MIEIPLAVERVGEYTCTASYHPDTRLDPSPVTGTFTVDLESEFIIVYMCMVGLHNTWSRDNVVICVNPGLLFTEVNLLEIGNSGEITLECSLAGYVEELTINEDLIDWTFNGQPLTTDSNYIISVASRECPPYGICGLGSLRIVDVGSDDLGDYVCSFGNLSQNIKLLEGDGCSLSSTHPWC